ncbi:carboxylating nicotinate-nucleotide diphosphorylase [Candidatus Gracilibacteria bacterium]|nr:carboxylating nicotinate-nucleotide diphosphorylase [Candidatus Gracilibacteria bacterium]MCF7856232.1 carboxylating nicotinate-nucleotide diphosphorylase [Candidatus Gracilibacteria bacterium]MCF7896703.1 carboxylating nicotinate-nucleotide diphosphorylase [Candidatus Gracilibacteria bacterium]
MELLLAQDVGKDDITTALLAKPKKIIQAEIRAKEKGILAGVEETKFFLKRKGVRILKNKKDGATVKKNDVVFVLQAPAKKILTLERVVLNLIQRMSGIATATAKLAKKIGKNKFSATRKTPLGLLDSRAVVVGGGLPHRLNLADMILVKENHLAVDPNCWKKIHTKDFFEIEADSPKLALAIAEHFSKSRNLILLLDNFSVAQFRETATAIRKINPKIILEASGGIDEKTAPKFLAAGADFVSLGKLTNTVGVVDFSLSVV